MSPQPHPPPQSPEGAPIIPPIPSAFRKGKSRSRGLSRSDVRLLIWAAALGLGIALGTCAYQWAPNVDGFFDYLFCLVFGA